MYLEGPMDLATGGRGRGGGAREFDPSSLVSCWARTEGPTYG